jgi:photosystem II stability/assembly factor-like uncharacterized protein
MFGQNDGWIAGDGGTILRYQESGQWVMVAGPTSADLRSVYFLDSTHGWIVGSSGTILHFDGTSWTKVSAFATANLFSVIQVSSAEAWAVGDSGTIIHWNGVAWYPYTPTPPLTGNPSLNSIFLLSSGYGLIVGAPPAQGSQATVLLVNQRAITQVPDEYSRRFALNSVSALRLEKGARLFRHENALFSRSPTDANELDERGNSGLLETHVQCFHPLSRDPVLVVSKSSSKTVGDMQ